MAQKFLNGIDISGNIVVDSNSAVGATVLDIQGTQGQLFSLTNSLSGDLFSVSDISGIPILNVNSSGLINIDGYINLSGTTTDYYIGGSGGGEATNELRIGSRTTSNTVALELFHAANPVSLGITYSGGAGLAFIESVHGSYDVNTHLLFKPGGTETWRIGSHGTASNSVFLIQPASNTYDFIVADAGGTPIITADSGDKSVTFAGTVTANGTVLTGDQTLPTASSLGAVTLTGTQSISGAKTFTSGNNYYSGHLYYTSHDAAGNHYPHFLDGSSNGGTTVNWRQYYGSSQKTHTWTSDSSGNMVFTYQGAIKAVGELEATSLDINGNADISGNLSGVDTYTGENIALTVGASGSGRRDPFTALHASNNTITISQFGQSHADSPAANQIGVTNAEQHLHLITDTQANMQAGTSTKGIFLRSGGNVGIGTKSPGAKLDVAGEVQATSLDINGDADISGDLTGLDNVTSTNFIIGGHTISDVDITSEVSDADDHLMTALAIKNKIEDYSYLTSSSTQAKYLRSDTSDTTTGSLTIEGGIQIEGSLSRGTYVTAANYHTGADNIVLKGNASGISGIFFESEKDGTNINHPSDFAFIQYHPYGTVNSSGEASELIIGVSNDSDDHVVINTPNVEGFVLRVGALEVDYKIYHEGHKPTLTELGAQAAGSYQASGNYITGTGSLSAQDLTDIGNLSGTNTGDQTTLPATTSDTLDFFQDSSGVSLHQFNNSLNDVGGNYNATSTGASYGTGLDTRFGTHGINTQGDGTYVDIAGLPQIQAVSIWYKAIGNDNGYIVDFRHDNPNNGRSYLYTIAGSDQYINMGNDTTTSNQTGDIWINGVAFTSGQFNFTSGNWYHIVITTDATNTLQTWDQGIRIGNRSDGTSNGNAGYFDQVRTFNRRLTSTDVALLYSEVETGATADQTAGEILSLIKTVDGASSGLDADLLDGNQASAFALSSVVNQTDFVSAANGGTFSGNIAGTTASFSGKVDFQGDAAIEGGSGYGVFKGYTTNDNHFISVRGVVANTAALSITGGHQTTFVEHADAADEGWYFKSFTTGTYREIARIDGLNEMYLGGNQVYHEGHKPTLAELGAAADTVVNQTDFVSAANGGTFGGGISVEGNILLTGTATTANQGRIIDFTGFDKEGVTDFSDRAYISHTANTGGHTGSVLVISSQNDANDGIAFATSASSNLKHNSNIIWTAGNDGPTSGLAAQTAATAAACTGNAATATNVAYSGLTGTVPTWNQNTTGSAGSVAWGNITSRPYIETGTVTSATTTTTVTSVVHATYTAAFFDFVIKNGANVRAGIVYACHDGTNVEYAEASTVDLGDTSDVTLSVDISGTNMRLRATTTSSTWTIKSLTRAI